MSRDRNAGSLKLFFIFLIMYMYVSVGCRCPWRPGKGIGSPEARGTGDYELSNMALESAHNHWAIFPRGFPGLAEELEF